MLFLKCFVLFCFVLVGLCEACLNAFFDKLPATVFNAYWLNLKPKCYRSKRSVTPSKAEICFLPSNNSCIIESNWWSPLFLVVSPTHLFQYIHIGLLDDFFFAWHRLVDLSISCNSTWRKNTWCFLAIFDKVIKDLSLKLCQELTLFSLQIVAYWLKALCLWRLIIIH